MPDEHILRNEAPHSVTLSMGQSGKVGLEVKVYGSDPNKAYEAAKALFDRAKLELGMGR